MLSKEKEYRFTIAIWDNGQPEIMIISEQKFIKFISHFKRYKKTLTHLSVDTQFYNYRYRCNEITIFYYNDNNELCFSLQKEIITQS